VRRVRESLPSRGAWIETLASSTLASGLASLPSRGAWIETSCSSSDSPRS